MPRYSYGRGDTPWVPDGDPFFRGVNMLLDRSMLQPGTLARSENKRLRDGVAATRPGTTSPGDFNPAFENTIIGSGIYSNPNGEEVMLVATAGANYVWALQFGKDPVQIQIDPAGDPTGLTGNGIVNFVQAFDKVFLLRVPVVGPNAILVWDGIAGNKFTEIALSPIGLNLIPATWDGRPFQNRILLYSPYFTALPGRDRVIMTDPLDYTSYDSILGQFRINAGESDLITSVVPYFRGAILVFMLHSVHMLENFTIDPFQASQRLLNGQIGSVGYQMPLQVGADVMFLSRPGGIYRVSEIALDEIKTPPVPVSRPIQPIIDRINWDWANLAACSAQVGDQSYFAFPLDATSGGSNVITVFNNITNEWESAPDSWGDLSFRINRMHVTLYNGSPRLFALDFAAKRIYLMYDGVQDEINGDFWPVRDVMETRGYVSNDPGSFKRFERVLLGLRTYDPSAIVTALSDGVNEEKVIATITKDRLRFYVHAHPPFDPIAGDPNEAKRKDYSLGGDQNFAIEDFEDLPVGRLDFIPGSPFVFNGVKQQSLEKFQIRQNGRWCSIRVENNQGQCDVLGVGVDALPSAQEGIKTLA